VTDNFLKIFGISVFALVISGADAVYALPEKLKPLESSISNFSMVMLVILLFLVILFVGLTIYNKIFISAKLSDYELRKYNLADSVDKDDAILNYVTKNKLR